MTHTDETAVIRTETAAITSDAHAIPKDGILISHLLQTSGEEGVTYSMAVTLFSGDGTSDARLIPDVTRDPQEAERLFRMITDGTVTPCTLADVLEDLL